MQPRKTGLKKLFLIENSDRSTFQPDLTVLVKPPKDHWKSDNLREPPLRRLFLEPSLLEKNTVKHSYPLSVFYYYQSNSNKKVITIKLNSNPNFSNGPDLGTLS